MNFAGDTKYPVHRYARLLQHLQANKALRRLNRNNWGPKFPPPISWDVAEETRGQPNRPALYHPLHLFFTLLRTGY